MVCCLGVVEFKAEFLDEEGFNNAPQGILGECPALAVTVAKGNRAVNLDRVLRGRPRQAR